MPVISQINGVAVFAVDSADSMGMKIAVVKTKQMMRMIHDIAVTPFYLCVLGSSTSLIPR